jgi:hypothetical protein
MNKRKRGRPPKPVTFGPPTWMPIDAAFFRIRDGLGSGELAARDLHRDLLTGRLKAARRGFDSSGVEIEAVECDPDFWQGSDFKLTWLRYPDSLKAGVIFKMPWESLPRISTKCYGRCTSLCVAPSLISCIREPNPGALR